MRPIDADALMEMAKNHVNGMVDCNDIARFPTINAAPVVHGRWEYSSDGRFLFCSECGEIPDCFEPNYCPNCGAKMDLDDDDETHRCKRANRGHRRFANVLD